MPESATVFRRPEVLSGNSRLGDLVTELCVAVSQLRVTWLTFAAALIVAITVISVQVAWKGAKTPVNDEFIYLTIADDLNTHGVFTDGHGSKGTAPSRFFAPAYPMLLHVISRADPALARAIACHVNDQQATRAQCTGSVLALQIVQIVLAAVQALSIFIIALVLSRSAVVAWLAMAIALGTGEFGYYAWTYLTENTAFLGFYLFLAFAVIAVSGGRVWAYAAAGVALAFAALSRPSYLPLFYGLIPLIAVLALLPRRLGTNTRLVHAGAFALAGALVLAPWMARNWALFGDPVLTAGYGGFILVQRVAYNAMTWAEWGVTWIYWLPLFGESLAEALFASELYIRLNFTDPESFFLVGNGRLRAETLVAAGGSEQHMRYLLREYVVGDLFKHVMVTLPLTLRGIWAGKYLAPIGLILLIPVARRLAWHGRLLPFLALAFPLVFMAGLHGFVSVNVVRYNLPFIALFAFVCAYTLVGIARKAGIGQTENDHPRS